MSRFLLSLAWAALWPVALAAAAKPAANPPSDYKGAIVIDAATGEVLFEDKADVSNPPASVTKIMTFLIVHDRIAAGQLTLETPVVVTADDARMVGTRVELAAGETFTVNELLFALMIQSANDAAHALARAAAGSREAFVVLMNERAKALGLTRTTFRTPHGLPPASRKLSEGDLTCPRDLAQLSREVIFKTDILRYTSVKQRVFRPGGIKPREVVMNSHNHLLGRVNGVDGLKTGYTAGAGFCLAATAQRNGRRIIVVTMGSPSTKVRDIKVAELIERGFAQLKPLPPGSALVPAQASPFTPAASPPPAPSPKPTAIPAAGATSDPGPTIRFTPRRPN